MSSLYEYSDPDFFLFHAYDDQPDSSFFYQHTHTQAELLLFLAGSGTLHIEGNAYPLTPGDLHVMAPSEFHYIEVDTNKPYERIVLNFNPDIFRSIDPEDLLIQAIADRNPGKQNLFPASEFPGVSPEGYFLRMLRPEGDPRINLLSGLIPLLGELYRIHSARTPIANESATLEYRIIRYINKHLFSPINLDDLCHQFFLSKAQLCRVFKKATGTTVWQYITIKRLVAARQQILAGHAPTQVCSQCGFNDYSSFYRAYQKYYGHSPKKDI